MAKFDSKSFNPAAFGAYIKNVKNLKQNALAKSAAIGTNEQARLALSNQTGSLFCTVPYFGRINGSTSQNNDGGTDITATSLTTFEQGFVVANRMDSWVEKSFSKNITAGVDFMDNVATQISDYKFEVKQGIILAILNGVFGMSTTGSTNKAKAAKAFVVGHTKNVVNIGDGMVGAATLNSAIQAAGGDNKNAFKLVLMHSAVTTNLENLRLLEYLKYTDAFGVTSDLAIGTWNGRTVLVDDNMPTEDGYFDAESTTVGALKVVASGATAGQINLASVTPYFGAKTLAADDYVMLGTRYTSYVLGDGAIILDDIGDAVPYEMSRDAAKNGGQDTLFVRDRFVCGAEGLSFVKPAGLVASASNTDLSTGTNWEVINNGTDFLEHKAIPIARIYSKG